MNYRPDIDGLRAIAVLPVMLFHAGVPAFAGGFVGVDVFFVISGFLITGILLGELEQDRFSLLGFYERRARRILPALFTVLLVCLPFAWFWMLPDQMRSFSQGLVAVAFFLSNVFLWRESGYFAPAAEKNPLLHTWSLAVEEQFYLFFPLLLVLLWRFARPQVSLVLLGVLLGSLALSELGWRRAPDANFYLGPSRAWELLAGALCALHLARGKGQPSTWGAALGLGLVLWAIFRFDEGTPFPSLYALVPVVGTVLIILCAAPGSVAYRLLSHRSLVGVGLISYSAYLWHQPVFAFARLGPFPELSLGTMLFLCALTLGLAYLSWRFVEAPFRRRGALAHRGRQTFLLGSLALLLAFGGLGMQREGFLQERFSLPEQRALAVLLKDNGAYVRARFEALPPPGPWGREETRRKVLLLGDSFAQDLINLVYEAGAQAGYAFKAHHLSVYCGNLFLPYEEKAAFIPKAQEGECLGSALFEHEAIRLALKEADEVWLASSWRPWQGALLARSLANLTEVSSAEITVFGRKDLPKLRASDLHGRGEAPLAALTLPLPEARVALNETLKRAAQGHRFIDLQTLVCGPSPTECAPFTEDGVLKSYDGAHLTKGVGSVFGGNIFKLLGKAPVGQ